MQAMVKYVIERAVPKEAQVFHLAPRQPRATSRAPSAILRRQPAGAKPSAQVQHELQDIIESVLGAPVAPDIPLMQVLPSSINALALHVQQMWGLSVHTWQTMRYSQMLQTTVISSNIVQAGLDLLGAVELRNAIMAKFGITVSPTVAFDHPTPAALAAHLSAALSASAGDSYHEVSRQTALDYIRALKQMPNFVWTRQYNSMDCVTAGRQPGHG